MNTFEQRHQNDLKGLRIVHMAGWLRARELGAFMWPANKSSAEAASRLIRGWEDRKLVLTRDLPERAGKAVVLAIAGVKLLQESGIDDAKTGKDWGTIVNKIWHPPASWKHDLIALGVLAEMKKRGYAVHTEVMIRRAAPDALKLPDGIFRPNDSETIWLEAERSAKGGKYLQQLAKWVSLAAAGEIEIAGLRCTGAMIAYIDIKDSAGHVIDHKTRVINAISEHTKKTIDVVFARCILRGAGVESVTLTTERIEPSGYRRVLRVLNANSWQADEGVLRANYGNYAAYVWSYGEGFSWLISKNNEDRPAGFATTISEAKKRCAEAIALESIQ